MTEYITVVPAYGREYATQKAARADWEAGKDFRIRTYGHRDDGRYISCRDKTPGMQITIRFHGGEKLTVIK